MSPWTLESYILHNEVLRVHAFQVERDRAEALREQLKLQAHEYERRLELLSGKHSRELIGWIVALAVAIVTLAVMEWK